MKVDRVSKRDSGRTRLHSVDQADLVERSAVVWNGASVAAGTQVTIRGQLVVGDKKIFVDGTLL
jgi:hypothetical protein